MERTNEASDHVIELTEIDPNENKMDLSDRVIDDKFQMESIKDYSKEPRLVLEQKARMLDSLECNLAAVWHGCLHHDTFVHNTNCMFNKAPFWNYFNQSYFVAPEVKLPPVSEKLVVDLIESRIKNSALRSVMDSTLIESNYQISHDDLKGLLMSFGLDLIYSQDLQESIFKANN